jgi:Helix-turn-helix domain
VHNTLARQGGALPSSEATDETNTLADDFADRIALADHPDEIEGHINDAWVKHTHSHLTIDEYKNLQTAGLARMGELENPEPRPKPRQAPSHSPRAAAHSPQASPNKAAPVGRGGGRPLSRLREIKTLGQAVGDLLPGRRRNEARGGPQPKREKMFGEGRAIPLDGNVKARIWTRAKVLSRRIEPGKHYGLITAKFLGVLKVLLWSFHNAKSGRCFPSYEAIAAKADCHRDTVAEAIKALEDANLLSWCNRLARVAIDSVAKLIRTSNSYWFHDPGSKSEFPFGPRSSVNQESKERNKESSFPINNAKINRPRHAAVDTDAPSRREAVSR